MPKINCDECGKELGLLNPKFKNVDKKGNNIILCGVCDVRFKENYSKSQNNEMDKLFKKSVNKTTNIKKKQPIKTNVTNMTKWEYYTKRYKLSFLNEPKKQKEDFDELGKDGWELVSVVPIAEPVPFTTVPVTKAVIAYFKREKK